MNKRKHLAQLACILSIAAVCMFCTSRYGLSRNLKDSVKPRADLIKIDVMTIFGQLEKQPVEFLHDVHTERLAQKNLDCTACHLTEKDRISPKFKRIKDTDRIEVMNIYHKECISCHGEMKVAHEKAGPVECDGCHREKAQYGSSRQPMGFDKALHYRHSEAQEKKCGKCHHEYDEKEKKLFYAKEKEGTCRYCHGAETKEKVISMRLASHVACIDCHSKNLAKNLNGGPVTCWGCHDSIAQGKIKKIAPVPRMERKQPDIVLLKTAETGIGVEIEKQNRMNFVPFDHQKHETYNETCRGCHHDTLKPCNQCHTLAGTMEGKEVNLENAMHRIDTSKSCIGCHSIKQEDANCRGCHALMGKARKQEDDSCLKCHMVPTAFEGEKGAVLNSDMEKSLAADMLNSRTQVAGTYDDNDIPEKVVIQTLSKEYEAVDFPHRKIVKTLVSNIKDNKLAGYFHGQKGTICKGCHHNSPISRKPPQCGNCHTKAFDANDPLKPGIIGAYHQQCMGCHQEMGIKKLDGCTDCHKKR